VIESTRRPPYSVGGRSQNFNFANHDFAYVGLWGDTYCRIHAGGAEVKYCQLQSTISSTFER